MVVELSSEATKLMIYVSYFSLFSISEEVGGYTVMLTLLFKGTPTLLLGLTKLSVSAQFKS